jgi:hypothetical protein
MGKPIETRIIDGIEYRECLSPHHIGERWLPFHKFYLRQSGGRKGRPYPNCKACHNFVRSGRQPNTGYVHVSQVRWIIRELENRLGRIEAIRRTGIGVQTWYNWVVYGKYTKMRRSTAAKLVITLNEVRANNEVRHRDSIKRGATRRGVPEKIPTKRNHFYRPNGDNDNENRKAHYHKNREKQLEQDRERKRRKRNLTSDAKSAIVPALERTNSPAVSGGHNDHYSR